MKYALSVHLQIDTLVIDPIAIVSLRLMARSKRPLTVQRQLSILATTSTSTGVSRFVYTFHIANWTTAVLKIEHRVFWLLRHFRNLHCSLTPSPKVLLNVTFYHMSAPAAVLLRSHADSTLCPPLWLWLIQVLAPLHQRPAL